MLRQHVSTDDLPQILKYISKLEKKPNESTTTQVDEEEDESMGESEEDEESDSISSTESEVS